MPMAVRCNGSRSWTFRATCRAPTARCCWPTTAPMSSRSSGRTAATMRAACRPSWAAKARPFMIWNRNKRSVVIDLKTEAGKAQLLRLIDAADVLIENFRPGTLERLGLGWPTLSGPQSAPDLCRDIRLRPDRPLSRPRRLRSHHPGHVGIDERVRPEGRAAASHADRHLGCRRGHAPGRRRPGRAGGAPPHRAGAAGRDLAARSRRSPSASTRPRMSPPPASGRRGWARRIAAARPTRCSRRPTAGSPSAPPRTTSGPGCAICSGRPS